MGISLFLVPFSIIDSHADSVRPMRPVHTYSIVARDPNIGELGAAVQSHWFSVGSGVIWAQPGIGAVATQSFTDPSYGPLGLELMRVGKDASQALTALLAADGRVDESLPLFKKAIRRMAVVARACATFAGSGIVAG